MSKYAKANDFLMQEKADKIKSIGCKVDYYTKEDREDIFSWSEEECEQVYMEIKNHIIFNAFGGLSTHFCPFCAKNKSCKECQYGKNHGICDEDEIVSDWLKVTTFIRTEYSKNSLLKTHYDLFPIAFYKEALIKMEAIVNE